MYKNLRFTDFGPTLFTILCLENLWKITLRPNIHGQIEQGLLELFAKVKSVKFGKKLLAVVARGIRTCRIFLGQRN